VGIGLDALVKAGQISMLMTPELGLKGVVNPLAPTGAEDPETRDKARQNAPRTVLTMDRVVSFLDYENYANAYPGIGKARAALLWKGEQRIVHLTVAAANEGAVSGDLSKSLTGSIDAARHPEHQVRVGSFRPLTFDVKARVLVDESYILENVLADVSTALKKAFAFDSRDFGQAVTPGEVTAVIQGVKGVTAVDLEKLDGQDPFSREHFRIPAGTAHWDENQEEITAAELLTINPNGIELLEMIT
jgi:predicted phage baseplate assembly protein